MDIANLIDEGFYEQCEISKPFWKNFLLVVANALGLVTANTIIKVPLELKLQFRRHSGTLMFT